MLWKQKIITLYGIDAKDISQKNISLISQKENQQVTLLALNQRTNYYRQNPRAFLFIFIMNQNDGIFLSLAYKERNVMLLLSFL